MRAIHVSVSLAPVRGALSHGDHGESRLLNFFFIIIIIIIISYTSSLGYSLWGSGHTASNRLNAGHVFIHIVATSDFFLLWGSGNTASNRLHAGHVFIQIVATSDFFPTVGVGAHGKQQTQRGPRVHSHCSDLRLLFYCGGRGTLQATD